MEFSDPCQDVLGSLSFALADLSDIPARQTANTGTYSYRYADLGDILAVVRPALAAQGLSVMQEVHSLPEAPGDVAVSTTFIHIGGQWARTAPFRLARGQTPQQAGSAVTYARRYSLLAACGLATEDDDAALAQSHARSPEAQQSTERTYRTPEEGQIHGILAGLPQATASAIRQRFLAEFNSNLSGLDPAQHGAALAFVRAAAAAPPPDEASDD